MNCSSAFTAVITRLSCMKQLSPQLCQLLQDTELTAAARERPAHTYPAHRPPSHSGQGLKSTERQKVIENSQRPRTEFQSRPRHTAQLAQPSPQGQLGELQPERLHTQHQRVRHLSCRAPSFRQLGWVIPAKRFLIVDTTSLYSFILTSSSPSQNRRTAYLKKQKSSVQIMVFTLTGHILWMTPSKLKGRTSFQVLKHSLSTLVLNREHVYKDSISTTARQSSLHSPIINTSAS